jgi:sugar-specific transcriptional regulator TrmB
MRDAYEMLTALGFSDYEARAYCALLDRSPANGYQVAQQSGIPRAKVYECIERLIARGAVVRVESLDEGARIYAPTDPKELIDSIESEMSATCAKARDALERYQGDPRVVEVLWRVVSEQDLVARGMSLTGRAKKTLHVALWPEEFEVLLPSFIEAAERGVRIALVLYSPHRGIKKLQELGAGAVRHGRSKREAVPVMGRQFVLVADSEQCITGSIFSPDNVEGVFTLNRGLVTNAVDLVNHEIYLERILDEVGTPVTDMFGKNLARLNAFDPPSKAKAG